MPMNKIVCNGCTYNDSDIISGSCHLGNSLVGDELVIDTLDATLYVEPAVLTTSDGYTVVTSDGYTVTAPNSEEDYKYGDIVKYYYDENLIGKFYLSDSLDRIAKSKYKWSCVSAIGLLENQTHFGGIYENAPAGDIIATLIIGVPYSISPEVAAVKVSGWLPIATNRSNLHQVLFAIGAGIFKDENGDIDIRFATEEEPIIIPDSRIYIDGSRKVNKAYTRIDVTEPSYYALDTDQVNTLYETDVYVSNQLVKFSEPHHNLTAEGLTINSFGVNHAYVTGIGKLTGQVYTRTQRVISINTGIAGTTKIATIDQATLVSALNSYNVASRLKKYYSETAEVNCGLVVGTERPATRITFKNPFGDVETGYIKSLDINISKTLKADARIAVGHLPTDQGNNYKAIVIIDENTVWTAPYIYDTAAALIPGTYSLIVNGVSYYFEVDSTVGTGPVRLVYHAGTTALKVFDLLTYTWLDDIDLLWYSTYENELWDIDSFDSSISVTGETLNLDYASVSYETLIAADYSFTAKKISRARAVLISGGTGGNGGYNGENGSQSSGGLGGDAGSGGNGGKVYVTDLNINTGDTMTLTIGNGGAGGASNNGAGAEGGNTTLALLGVTYSSANGISKATGYKELFTGIVYAENGEDGELNGGKGSDESGTGPSVTKGGITYHPGANGDPYTDDGVTAIGGFGGGAASAGNGTDGADGWVERVYIYGQGYVINVWNGNGGNGGPGAAGANATTYGQGGQGGDGGGGGGQSLGPGGSWGNPGVGGAGGVGGDGAQGVAIIYF